MFDEKYKNVTFKGSVFPDKPIKDNIKITLNKYILEEYIPTMNKVLEKDSYNLRLLCVIMTWKEGFYKGSRSYRTNNAGNIGNTDNGLNRHIATLPDGILAQKNYIYKIINGHHKAYPMYERKIIKPYFSKEIAKNSKRYGLSPWLAGYDFVFTGQLDQFVKIYSTGARAGNGYLSSIISFFKSHGVEINAQSKIQDIIK